MSTNSNTNTTNNSEFNYPDSEIEHRFRDFNVLKDGTIHIFSKTHLNKYHPSSDNEVSIKDIEISSNVSARVFIPTSALTETSRINKLPLVFYIHGGAFCKHSAFNEPFTRFVSNLVQEANVVGVSVEYRMYPTHVLPACYDDSWEALQWVASHSTGSGPDSWINNYADLSRVFVVGNSAGGNIAHYLLAKVGFEGLQGDIKIEGMVLIQPYFGDNDPLWMFMCPTNEGPHDPRMKPAVNDLAKVACNRVLVALAEKDQLYGVGKLYVDEIVKSGWKGKVEWMVSKGEKHGFQLWDHDGVEAVVLRKRVSSFINHEGSI